MTIINGINVAIYQCKECKSPDLWIFRGQNGEGYKIVCAKCHTNQRELVDELGLPYLWRHKEVDEWKSFIST